MLDFTNVTLGDILDDVTLTPEPVKEEVKEEVKKEETKEEAEEVKEEVQEGASDAEVVVDSTLIDDLKKAMGYEIEDDFEDSVEGLSQFTHKVAEEIASQKLEELFDSYPDVKEFLDYVVLNGDPKEFVSKKFPSIDYAKIEITEEDEATQKSLVSTWLRQQGLEEDEINKKVEKYLSAGILTDEAESALKRLQKKQVAEKANLLKEQEAKEQERQKEVTKYWDGVKKTIDKTSSFKGIPIPEKEKKAFFEYLAVPKKDGRSQSAIDDAELSMEDKLTLQYLKFKKLNLSELIKREAQTSKANSLKERMKGHEETVVNKGKPSVGGTVNDAKFDEIIG
jgi:hypothetical protein